MTLDELRTFLQSAGYATLIEHGHENGWYGFELGTKHRHALSVWYDDDGMITVYSQRRQTRQDETLIRALKDEPNYRPTAPQQLSGWRLSSVELQERGA